MSKPRAYIQVDKLFRIDGTPMLVSDLTHEDVEEVTYTIKKLPEEVEIMFWGDVVEFCGPDNTIPLASTFAFVRIKSIGAVAIKFPTELSFDPE